MHTLIKHFIESLGEPIEKVVQTHISIVYLTKHFAYKQKKPLFFGFLDYRTVELREKFCRKELKLNSRFSNIYLDVKAVHDDGKVADWIVVMKRLKDDRMLKYFLLHHSLTESMIDKFVNKFYQFSMHNKSDAAKRFGDVSIIANNWNENFQQTTDKIAVLIEENSFKKIRTAVDRFLLKKELFDKRIKLGTIIDGHGDIRIEHIYFENGDAYMLDCIEFNDRFRIQDRLLDFSFLMMDLEYNGYQKISNLIYEKYCNKFNETEIAGLTNFYKCYRAYVRGKVEGFMYDETKSVQNFENAKKYFHLSDSYADKF